ncbi:MAG: hypothetical protein ABI921_12765, partial [Panacibacter sp.]
MVLETRAEPGILLNLILNHSLISINAINILTMQNYLLKYLESYFDEILVIEGNLTVSESFMQQTLKAIKERVFYDNDLIS